MLLLRQPLGCIDPALGIQPFLARLVRNLYRLPLKDDEVQKAVDKKSLRLFISLLDHEIPNSPYESVVLSALSVLGLRDSPDGTVGWKRPYEYTSTLSAAINIGRLLVLHQSYEECRRVENAGTEEERVTAPGLFDSIQGKVLRYLTVVLVKIVCSKFTLRYWVRPCSYIALYLK